MKLRFYKYQGTGNDFIMIDGREKSLSKLTEPVIQALCHRRFGIGADGLIILRNSADHDFEMEYYNSDGKTSSMCGNGGRCILRFARDLGMLKDEYLFTAIDGLHSGKIEGGQVHLKMKDVEGAEELSANEFFLDTGSPHHVIFEESLPGADFLNKAMAIRYSERYREPGVNVNYVVAEEDHLSMRTYERGVEGETYSCGTGVTAAALAADLLGHRYPNAVSVKTTGGDLEVDFTKNGDSYSDIWLIGPAQKVFEGETEI